MPGFGAMLVADPAAALAAVALLNGPDEGDLTKLVAGYALALWRGDAGDPPRYEPTPPTAPPAGEAPPYTGRYGAYNPWLPSFRVVARGEALSLAFPYGDEEPLTALCDGVFRVGADWSPERLRLDAIVEGEALRANLSGCDYYRV